MNRKPETEREAQNLFDDLRHRAKEDAFLSSALRGVEEAESLLSEDDSSQSETCRLPYSSMMLWLDSDWK